MSPGTKFGSTGESDINDDDSQTQNGRQVDQSASGTVEQADQSNRRSVETTCARCCNESRLAMASAWIYMHAGRNRPHIFTGTGLKTATLLLK